VEGGGVERSLSRSSEGVEEQRVEFEGIRYERRWRRRREWVSKESREDLNSKCTHLEFAKVHGSVVVRVEFLHDGGELVGATFIAQVCEQRLALAHAKVV
jgi:hypothetical protein